MRNDNAGGRHPADTDWRGEMRGGDAQGPRGGDGGGDGVATDVATDVDQSLDLYTEEDIANLLYLLEEEKLAGDLYEVLYEQTGLQVFNNIAASEDNHMAALVAQAESLDLDIDSILLLPAGEYEDPALQELYDTLLAQASVSTEAALEVGVLIETTDIVDLQEAADSVEGTPLEAVYENLLDGSLRHLDAFESLLA